MRVFLIAGEASGDRLGAALMAGLKTLGTPEFMGVGGPLMQAEGMNSLFPMDELSVMGLAEVLPKYPHLRRRMLQCADAVLDVAPDVLITIDAPDFGLRVARRVKAKSGIRTVHYVAPSVWAWRPGRVKKLLGVVDQVLALLPFEPPYFTREGLTCDFVGHPVVTEPVATPEQIAAFRWQYKLGDAPILLVLPGSRRKEVARFAPMFGDVLHRVCAAKPDLRVILPTTGPRTDQIREATQGWPIAPLILSPNDMSLDRYKFEKMCAFGAATRALAVSGTVSLELAASDTPMVIAYDANWLTRKIMQRLLLVDTLTLVNLVSDTRHIPELLGEECTADRIAPAVLDLFNDASAQHDAMRTTMEQLGRGGEAPGLRAARAVIAGFG